MPTCGVKSPLASVLHLVVARAPWPQCYTLWCQEPPGLSATPCGVKSPLVSVLHLVVSRAPWHQCYTLWWQGPPDLSATHCLTEEPNYFTCWVVVWFQMYFILFYANLSYGDCKFYLKSLYNLILVFMCIVFTKQVNNKIFIFLQFISGNIADPVRSTLH